MVQASTVVNSNDYIKKRKSEQPDLTIWVTQKVSDPIDI